jgi:methylaspartate mutase sigma subunit
MHMHNTAERRFADFMPASADGRLLDAAPPAAKVILGVAASDAHVVANHLIALQLRNLGYQVINLGACTPVSDFLDCAARNPDAIAIVIGSVNGHAIEDLRPLRAARDEGLLRWPVIVGGNLSVGSTKTGQEADNLYALGVDRVLGSVEELFEVLGEYRTTAELDFEPDGLDSDCPELVTV